MAWTSSTAIIGVGVNGVTSTTSNNALIVGGDYTNDYLEVYGVSERYSVAAVPIQSAQCFTPRKA